MRAPHRSQYVGTGRETQHHGVGGRGFGRPLLRRASLFLLLLLRMPPSRRLALLLAVHLVGCHVEGLDDVISSTHRVQGLTT